MGHQPALAGAPARVCLLAPPDIGHLDSLDIFAPFVVVNRVFFPAIAWGPAILRSQSREPLLCWTTIRRSSRPDIDQLLEQLGRDGQIESVGHFTLAAAKLREKLAASQFERPTQWVLKLIQALALARVRSCEITQSRSRTKFVLQNDKSLFSAEELEQAFFDPGLQTSFDLSQFLICIWYLSFNLKVAWLWQDCGSQVGLFWTGSELKTVERSKTATLKSRTASATLTADGGATCRVGRLVGPRLSAVRTHTLCLHLSISPYAGWPSNR